MVKEQYVFKFNKINFSKILLNLSYCNKNIINKKNHLKYLNKYLIQIKTQTIIVESKYRDKDFFEDFSHYYVRCFEPYQKLCIRLHFFKSIFNQKEFEQSFESNDIFNLQNDYLGYVVLKDLPFTIIGKTCLKIDDTNALSKYPIIRTYDCNLYGIPLKIETLAFQEQDRVVSVLRY